MTIDPASDPSRKALVALLTGTPERFDDRDEAERRRIWARASEQERRKMLKDCGWL